jgi:hypothetical protein
MSTLNNITIAGFQGMVKLPVNYNPTTKYVADFFLPGEGESAGPVTKLQTWGPFKWITETTDLGHMIQFGFIPGVAWGLTNAQITALVNGILAAYPNIYAFSTSGLSEGCQQWANWMESDENNFKQVAACYWASAETEDMPPYGTANFNAALYAKYPVFDCRGCGTNDPFYSTQVAREKAIAAAPPLVPNVFQIYTGSGHDGTVWDPFFNPAGTIPLLGKSKYADLAARYPPIPSQPNPVTPPVQTPANVVITTATQAQLGTPTAPTVFLNPVTKAITVWNGTAWT